MNLLPSDVEMFRRLGIPVELVNRAGVVRVTDREARGIYGIKGGGDMAGLAFVYFDPQSMANGRRRIYVRIRRDHPDVDEDGRTRRKYVAPYGDRKHLYFPPKPEWFADTDIPICLVEAEKSSQALLAWSERTGRRILPLALGGCWGWRGKTGIKETATGERVPEHGALRELNICRNGRKTYVLFDANCASNPGVQAARTELVRQLSKQGADVHLLDLPASEGVNGPDDFIGVMGDEAMSGLFDGAAEGVGILDDVEKFLRRFLVMSNAQFRATALWVAHTWCFLCFLYTPYLWVSSAEKRCGKSRVIEACGFLVHRQWMTSGASAASLYREIEAKRPTVLLDELDRLMKGPKEFAQPVTAVLNAGSHHKGTVSRCVGEGSNQHNKDYSCFCPKAVCGIGDCLEDTVADRALHIKLQRKLVTEKVERLRERIVEPAAKALRQRLANWLGPKVEALKAWEPELPGELNDRQQDGAEPLFAIAELAGGPWPERARQALVELYTGDDAQHRSLPTLLLSDVRDIFKRLEEEQGREVESLSSAQLIEELAKAEHAIWKEYSGGKTIGQRALSSLLGKFDIGPRNVRQGGKIPKGYPKEAFVDAWKRYCPPLPAATPNPPLPAAPPLPAIYPLHPLQANVYAGKTTLFDPLQEGSVADQKSEESPVFMRVVADVADKRLEKGEAPHEERCFVHGVHSEWWLRGRDWLCERCHPDPR